MGFAFRSLYKLVWGRSQDEYRHGHFLGAICAFHRSFVRFKAFSRSYTGDNASLTMWSHLSFCAKCGEPVARKDQVNPHSGRSKARIVRFAKRNSLNRLRSRYESMVRLSRIPPCISLSAVGSPLPMPSLVLAKVDMLYH